MVGEEVHALFMFFFFTEMFTKVHKIIHKKLKFM